RRAPVHGHGACRRAHLRERQRGAVDHLQAADQRRAGRAAAPRGAGRAARGGDGAGGTDRVRAGGDHGGRAAQSPLDPPGAPVGHHLPGQVDHADGPREPAARAPGFARALPGGREGRLLPELPAVSWGPPRRAGPLRVGLQSPPGQLPGQRHHRAAHRELRVLARGEGWAGAAARGHAVEFGDAEVGGFPHGARDLVGDPVPVRPDGVEAEDMGKNGGSGKREGGRVVIGALLGLGIALRFPLLPSPFPAQDTTKGKAVYVKWCAGCHGEGGAGDGPAAARMLPRPRNFTGAIYKIRTTASGELPTDADLMRAIDEGLPGSAMPAWKGRLSDAERRDVAAYIKTFSTFFADTSQHVAALKFSGEPGGGTGADALKTGRQFYDSIGCRKCHGDQGRGDGPSAPTLKDDAGYPMFAADLHQSWR